MLGFRPVTFGLATFVLAASAASASDGVVASIRPVHSLVAGVMQGVGEPDLLLRDAGSPHSASLRPSQARALQEAGLIFWIGADLETFLEKPIGTLPRDVKPVALMETEGLHLETLREGGAFEGHSHDEHHAEDDAHDHDAEHAKHDDDHAHDDDHDHDAEHAKHDDDHAHDHDADHAKRDDHDHDHDADHAKHEDHDHDADHAEHDEDHHGAVNAHIWLDPENAKIMVAEIARALSAFDPANAASYRANADRMAGRLDALRAEMADTLAPVRDRPFIVFHDAYQNLEHRFGMTAVGAITVNPEVMPGAERVAELRAKVRELDAACVFAEPQFEPTLVSVIAEGTAAKTGVLDPLGTSVDAGPEQYFEMMRRMAAAMRECLSRSS